MRLAPNRSAGARRFNQLSRRFFIIICLAVLMSVCVFAVVGMASGPPVPTATSDAASSGAMAAMAATFTVNSLADTTDAQGCDASNCTLREAITAANLAGGADTINFDPALTADGPAVINLASALPNLSSDSTINGPGANLLSVKRNVATRFRIFTVTAGVTVNISGLTITGGFTPDGAAAGDVNGGGIFNGGTLSITNSTISSNQTGSGGLGGGGIYNDGTLSITNSTISGNQTASGSSERGGGIFNFGPLTLSGVAVSGNRTGAAGPGGAGGSGGGILNARPLTISNSTISGNTTGAGGGCSTTGCSGGRGGDGAGIYSVIDAITISNSTISGNMTGAGGSGDNPGIHGSGGGIFSGLDAITISNSTISGNSGFRGGGINKGGNGTITLKSSIVAGNSAADSRPDIAGTVQSDGFNLIQDPADAVINQNSGAGPDITNKDPQLGPLQDNGGPTQTHALGQTSPAIDQGKSFGLTTDQRGQTRPFNEPAIAPAANGGDNADVGAYEVIGVLQTGSPSFVVNTTADDNDECTAEAGGCTLREAINAANATAGANSISFSASLTSGGPAVINLTSALPDLASDITINGPGANLLSVKRNVATRFRIFTVTSGVTVNISGLTITGGLTADGATSGAGAGGGIFNDGTLNITNSTVSGNQTGQGGPGAPGGGAGGAGGGILNNGTLTISNSTINGNQTGKGGNGTAAGGGGGGGGGLENTGTLTITNSTISGNTTGTGGSGGISAGSGGSGGGLNSAGTLTISNSTITANTAVRFGGGIRQAGGVVTLKGNIVAGNSASQGSDLHGQFQSDGYNLIQSTSVFATINQNPGAGPDIAGQNPQLGPLQDNGGPTRTHALAPTSPAVDHGNGFGLTTDQRGLTRPVNFPEVADAAGGAGADIGAFELQTDDPQITGGGPLVVNATGDDADTNTADGHCDTNGITAGEPCTLRAALQEANARAGANTITFDPTLTSGGPAVINLASALPDLSSDITINGPGANLLSVKRDNAAATRFRILTITSGVTVSVSGLTLTGGYTADGEDGVFPRSGTSGGGIRNDGTLMLTGVAISGNRTGRSSNGSERDADNTIGGAGGGIRNAGTLSLINSTVSGNQTGAGGSASGSSSPASGGPGGGIFNVGTLSLSNSTVSGNQTGAGGVNSVGIAGDAGLGGGIWNAGPLTVNNGTIFGNTTGYKGGGVYQSPNGNTTLKSTIVAGNSAANSGPDIDGEVQSGGFNLIQDPAGASISGAGPDITGADPQLGPLQNNGGPTQTHAFALTSPAMDHGNSFGLTTDQRGSTRPVNFEVANAAGGDGADIGAFELQTNDPQITGGPLVVNSTGDAADTNPGDGLCDTGSAQCTLRAAIQEANARLGPNTISLDPALTSAGSALTPGGAAPTSSAAAAVINLTSALPDLSSDITINGPGANLLSVKRNVATRFRIFTISSGVTVNISGLTVTGGLTADGTAGGAGAGGGGIFNDGTLNITNSAISGNQTGQGGPGGTSGGAGGAGGGILNNGTLTISNSTISGNQPGQGGNGNVVGGVGGDGAGIQNTGTLTISNSTISGNTTGAGGSGGFSAGSGGSGGGLNDTGTLTISNSTITANTAGNLGGGIRRPGGVVTLRSTIVAGNSALLGPDLHGQFQSDGYNLVQSTSAFGVINQNPGAGPNITGVSANLSPLALNGGATQTHALRPNSPAIDQGNSFSLATDQRGLTRAVDFVEAANASGGDGADIGSFESPTFPTAANGEVSGRILDTNGAPLAGATVLMAGTQNRKFITDANGFYRFDNVGTGGFYTVTPTRANYGFNPGQRSFSVQGNKTEALFTGVFVGESANPLDTAEYFVRQLYLDVLGREPDEGGFNYWSDQINQCSQLSLVSSQSSAETNQADCVTARRIDVAAAFFIAREFQVSGAYIYNLYSGGLGRRPWFREYAVDRQQVVGGAELAAGQAAFAASFVARAEFVTKYEAASTAESFVAALLANVQQSAGVDLSSEREQLLARYQAGATQPESRALVLRGIAENAAFQRAQYNHAFVLTEYFSYLRRDADAAGFEFWLHVLNDETPGNYLGMVCAFMTAAEYQQRFSPVVSHSNAECARQEQRVAGNQQ